MRVGLLPRFFRVRRQMLPEGAERTVLELLLIKELYHFWADASRVSYSISLELENYTQMWYKCQFCITINLSERYYNIEIFVRANTIEPIGFEKKL